MNDNNQYNYNQGMPNPNNGFPQPNQFGNLPGDQTGMNGAMPNPPIYPMPAPVKKKRILPIIIGVVVAVIAIVAVIFIIANAKITSLHPGERTGDTYTNEFFDIQFELPEGFEYYSVEEVQDALEIDKLTKDGVPYYEYSDEHNEFCELWADSDEYEARIIVSYIDYEKKSEKDYFEEYFEAFTGVENKSNYYSVKIGKNEFTACDFSAKNEDGEVVNRTTYVKDYSDSLLKIEFLTFEDSTVAPFVFDYYFTAVGGPGKSDIKTSVKPAYGKVENKKYTNKRFGIDFKVPDDFKPGDLDIFASVFDCDYNDDGMPFYYDDSSEAVMLIDSFNCYEDDNDDDLWFITGICLPVDDNNIDMKAYVEDERDNSAANSSNTFVTDVYKTRLDNIDAYAYIAYDDDGCATQLVMTEADDGVSYFVMVISYLNNGISTNEIVSTINLD